MRMEHSHLHSLSKDARIVDQCIEVGMGSLDLCAQAAYLCNARNEHHLTLC